MALAALRRRLIIRYQWRNAMHAYRLHSERFTLVARALLVSGLAAAMPVLAQTPPEYLSNFSAATVPPPSSP